MALRCRLSIYTENVSTGSSQPPPPAAPKDRERRRSITERRFSVQFTVSSSSSSSLPLSLNSGRRGALLPIERSVIQQHRLAKVVAPIVSQWTFPFFSKCSRTIYYVTTCQNNNGDILYCIICIRAISNNHWRLYKLVVRCWLHCLFLPNSVDFSLFQFFHIFTLSENVAPPPYYYRVEYKL